MLPQITATIVSINVHNMLGKCHTCSHQQNDVLVSSQICVNVKTHMQGYNLQNNLQPTSACHMEMMHSSTQLHQQLKRQLLLMLVAITLEHPASI
jgi:hypothetical protein